MNHFGVNYKQLVMWKEYKKNQYINIENNISLHIIIYYIILYVVNS